MRKRGFFLYTLSLIGRGLWRILVLAFFSLLAAFSTIHYAPVVCAVTTAVTALVFAVALFIPGNLFARIFWRPRFMRAVTAFLLVVVMGASPFLAAYAYQALPTASNATLDTGFQNSDFLRDKYVLVLVPHQDDDVNMAGATIQSFVNAGSEVYVAFVTNGDNVGLSSDRLNEAVECMDSLGIPRQNVYFLGYGDDWRGEHLYNRAPDEPALSWIEREQTYGTTGIDDFSTLVNGEPHLYTRGNCLKDIRDLVDMLFPDMIFCMDYDPHADHRMTSLLFEEAMGQMLHEDPSYRPQVFKAISYLTAWDGPQDFYNIPMLETLSPSEPTYPLGTPAYRWSERVRFPVPNGYASYSLRANGVYKLHSYYASQYATMRSGAVANSDQVFFERATDSLLYGQRATASSGDAALLTDYKLFDTTDIRETIFDAGIWSPTDEARTVRYDFDAPQSLNTVTLWDNPSAADNVLAAVLTLSDGTRIDIPALDPLGASNTVTFEQRDGIEWMELMLTEVEGEQAGLTELEAALREERPTQFIKLMDEGGNFLYETPERANENVRFSLYAWPALPSDAAFTLTITNERGGYAATASGLTADALSVGALEKGTYRVRVTCEQDDALYDECVLRVGDLLLKERLIQWFEPRFDAAARFFKEKAVYIY